MGLPTKFKHLTLGQFIELHKLSLDKSFDTGDADIDNLNKDTKKLSILTGKTTDQIEYLDDFVRSAWLSYAKLVCVPPKDIQVKEKIIVKGRILYPTLSLQEMKVSQLTDFYSLYKESGNDHILSANNLLAVMFKPFSLFGDIKYDSEKHASISKLLLKAKAEDCLGLLFFYLRFWKKCEPRIQTCLENSEKVISEIMKEIQNDKEFLDSLNIGVGSTM